MKQFLFDKLKVGTAVTYMGMGLKAHDFFFVICKINKETKTVDIQRYSQATGKPDVSYPIEENVSLDNIEFFFTKDRALAQIPPSAFRF